MKGTNQRNKYRYELSYFRQTSENFTEFSIELMRKFDPEKYSCHVVRNIIITKHVGKNMMRRS